MILDQEKIARIKKILKFKPRGMSISEIASQLHMNRNSVAKYLEILFMNGEVEAKKLGTSKVYTISQRLPVSGWIGFSSDLIIIINPEGQVLQVNDAFLKFCNKMSEEIIGKRIKDLHNPLFFNVPLDNFLKESHEKTTEYFEISIDHNGHMHYFRGKLVPIIFDDGDKGILIIFEDISEKKHAEMVLAEREQQYRAVIENIQDVFYRSDNNGNLIMASPSWASLLGYDSLDECLGKNIAEIFYWQPEERKDFLDTVFAKGRVNDYEVILKTKDGRPFYVSTNSHLYFDNSGNILGVEGIFRDINERHASAEKIRNYIAQMKFFSHALQEFIELSPDADIFEKIGIDLYSLIPEAMIFINSFNSLTGIVTIRSVNPPKYKAICEQILRQDLIGIDLPINSFAYHIMRDGHLHQVNLSMHEAAFKALPLAVCEQIERELNFGDNYVLGFSRAGELFGNVAIYLPQGEKIVDTQFIETYGRAASIALQRRITEKSLRESQEIFQRVTQESPFPLAIIDDKENFRYINNSYTRIFGYNTDDFRSLRQWFLLAFPDPELRKRAIDFWISDIASFPEQGTIPRIFSVRCKDGSFKEVIIRAMVLSNKEKCIIFEDITERRKSEKIRKLLSCIVGSSNDAIIGKKIDGTIMSWNTAAERMYGYSLQEMSGKNISLVVPHELREELENILKQITQGEGVSNLETQRIKKDGTRIDVSVTISPIIDDSGVVIGASTISRDISASKSEQLLRKSEEEYQNLVETINVGVYRSTGDLKGQFIWGNTFLVRILGFSSLEKLKEIDISDIFVEPDGRKKLLDELQSTGFIKNREISLRRPDGNILIVSVTALAKFNQSNHIEFITGIVEDITGQKHALRQIEVLHHKLVDIIEFLPDPSFVIDQEHQVIAWNSAMEQLTGVNKKEILGQTDFAHAFPFYGTPRMILIDLIDLIDSPDDEIKKYYPDMKREGNSLFTKCFVPSLYSGKGAYLSAKAEPLHDEEGRRIGAIEIIRDISQVKELQELLKNAKDGVVSEMIGNISTTDAIGPVHSGYEKIKNPGVLSLLYLSNALKMAYDSITILDLSGRCIWVNDTFANIISLKKNDMLIGKSFAQFIAPEDRKNALDSLIDVRKSGNKRISLSLVTPSGRIPAEASLSSITDNEDGILGYMTIIRHTDQVKKKLYFKNNSSEKQQPKKRISKL
jgi:PAS domain S-box-containing protein